MQGPHDRVTPSPMYGDSPSRVKKLRNARSFLSETNRCLAIRRFLGHYRMQKES
jgi:hypothetical protein